MSAQNKLFDRIIACGLLALELQFGEVESKTLLVNENDNDDGQNRQHDKNLTYRKPLARKRRPLEGLGDY